MAKYVICANTVDELKNDYEAMMKAIHSGCVMGCGAETVEGLNEAYKNLRSELGILPMEEEDAIHIKAEEIAEVLHHILC